MVFESCTQVFNFLEYVNGIEFLTLVSMFTAIQRNTIDFSSVYLASCSLANLTY